MRQLLFVFALLLFTTTALKAQVKEVVIDIHGNYSVIVEVAPETYAEVSEWGELLDIIYERQTHGRDNRNNRRGRHPEHFPGVDIEYYDNFWDYKAGKIEKIGNVRFDYNSNILDYKAGKLSRVGTLNISYHGNILDYKSGKVSSIGSSIRIDYHNDLHEEKSGLLKNINNYQYDYSFPLVHPRQQSRRGRPSHNGPAMTGQRSVTVGGVKVTIVDKL